MADEDGEKPGIWDDYVVCIERKLAACYEVSLTASLRTLIGLISGFRSRPMFKLRVIVTPEGKITVGPEFEAVCNFFFSLPTLLSNNKEVRLLSERPPIKLFLDEKSGNEMEGLDTAVKNKITKARTDVNSYFHTLAHLQVRKMGTKVISGCLKLMLEIVLLLAFTV